MDAEALAQPQLAVPVRRTVRTDAEPADASLGQCAFMCFRRTFVQPLLTDSDTMVDISRKTYFTLAIVGGLLFLVLGLTFTYLIGAPDTLQTYTAMLVVVTIVGVFVWIRRYKRITDNVIWLTCLAFSMSILSMDLHGASAFQSRAWPMFVVILDVLLVCQVPDAATLSVVGAVSFWVMFIALEKGFRFGLFDIPGLPPEEQRRRVTDCDAPPCALNSWAVECLKALVVFVMDFAITRSFARQLQVQNAILKESVDVLGHIAEHLAAYDLHSAENVLLRHRKDLPGGMVEVFEELLANLRSYRPFLPDALFRDDFPSEREPSCGGGSVGESQCVSPLEEVSNRSGSDTESQVASVSAHNITLPAALARRDRATTLVLRQPARLDERRMSLLTVHLHANSCALTRSGWAPQTATETERTAYGNTYLVRHTASVAAVFDAVKAQRGSFDFFVGDRIHASFNAFNSALNHAVYAMSAASAVKAAVQADAEMYAAVSAVVTGTAYVGNLGTDAVRRPSVVGRLALLAGRMLRAGCLVEEDVVCCTRTRQEARFSHELRALLHTFVLGSGCADGGGQRVALYALREGVVGVSDSAEPQEWMYEIKDQETSGSMQHNRAADVLRREGAEAAVAAMREWGCAADMVARFEADVAGALVVDLRPQRSSRGAVNAASLLAVEELCDSPTALEHRVSEHRLTRGPSDSPAVRPGPRRRPSFL